MHDWNDLKALQILSTIRKSTKSDSTLLIADTVLNDGFLEAQKSAIDIQMMNLIDGKERSRKEFEQLLDKAGFKLMRVYRVKGIHSLLEAVPIN